MLIFLRNWEKAVIDEDFNSKKSMKSIGSFR